MSIDMGSAVGYLMLDTSDFQKGFDSAFRDMQSFMDKTNKASERLSAFGSYTTKVGTAFTKYLTLPLIGAGTAFTAFASEAQQALSTFSSKAGMATEDAQKYEDVLKSIYKNNYGESYEDIADSMGDVVVALGKMDPSNMQKVTESALTLRDVYGYEVPESLRTVDTLMKNFGYTADQAFDYIVKGQQEGLDFSGEFLDTINEYSVQFKKLGFDAEDMFAILKEGADSGAWNLDKIGDAIKEFSIRAIDGSDTTIAGFEAIGLSADDMAQKFGQGGDVAKEAFDQVINGLAGMEDPVQQNIAGVNLFGTMWEDLGPKVIEQLAGITGETINTKGAMDSLKEVKYDNLNSAIEQLGRTIQVAGASLGEYFIPIVQSAIDLVQGWTDKFNSLSEGTKQMIVLIGSIVAAIGPVLLIIGKVASAISGLMTLMSSTSTLIGTLGITLTGFLVPVAAVVAAIVALKAAWDTNFAGIRDTTNETLEIIRSIISSALSIIKSVVTTVLQTVFSIWNSNFANIQGITKAVFNTIQTTIQSALSMVSSIFAIFAAAFRGDWQGVWEGIKDLFSNFCDAVITLLANLVNLIIQTFIGAVGGIVDATMSIIKAFNDTFVKGWNDFIDWLNGVIQDPVSIVNGIGDAMGDAGAAICNRLWDGAKAVWEQITGWVTEAVNWLRDRVTFWENESAKMATGDSGFSAGGGSFSGGSSAGRRSVQGSYASGLDYVPRDMNVMVHEGEAILTKQQNLERGNVGGDTYIFQSPKAIDEVTAARNIRKLKIKLAEGLI